MQTFLPYESFEESAACLDRMRLGKQRVECLQILNTLNGESSGWRNHPAVKMWDGYVEALVDYGVVICEEWINRGYKDTCYDKIVSHSWGEEPVLPPWIGNQEFHDSHKSNLMRKLPEHYRQFFGDFDSTLPYIWPEAITV